MVMVLVNVQLWQLKMLFLLIYFLFLLIMHQLDNSGSKASHNVVVLGSLLCFYMSSVHILDSFVALLCFHIQFEWLKTEGVCAEGGQHNVQVDNWSKY